ncbi:MAG: hypothetical protein KJT03_07555 [Verrucomicrobiae bacterium]|nr:hypothetical protein [Verrucomicrobiae bacterium]
MSKIDKLPSSLSWQVSVELIESFLKTDCKLDELFDQSTRELESAVIRRVYFLAFGVVRNLGQLRYFLAGAVQKSPRKKLEAILLVAVFELLKSEASRRPQIVHHAVEYARRRLSGSEARFVNAVLRKLAGSSFEPLAGTDSVKALSVNYSHPSWMVERWLAKFGETDTWALLEWNQQIPHVYAWSEEEPAKLPSDWKVTQWSGFYCLDQADWKQVEACLNAGRAYIKDPSTRLGVESVKEKTYASILDLCAAPGGKSVHLQSLLNRDGGLLVSVDVPGKRFERLQENLARYQKPGINQLQVAKDVLQLGTADLPQADYDLVYLDVPCSNSGVLQRRPDVKWRQSSDNLDQLKSLQLRLISRAARFVGQEGTLVYSTCSIEEEENQGVIQTFLEEAGSDFRMVREVNSFPWKTGHDGAYFCRMDRTI